MEKILHFSGLLSHPGIFLERHLIRTAELTKLFLQEKPDSIRERFGQLLWLTALVHDIGKATSHFQDYLRNRITASPNIRKPQEAQHSLFSAVCAYYVTRHISDNLNPIFAFLAVKRHHGDLRDITDDIIYDERDQALLQRQLDSIPQDKFTLLIQNLQSADLPFHLDKNTLAGWFDDFIPTSRSIKRRIRHMDGSIENYLNLNFLYSLLLDADKSSAGLPDNYSFNRPEFEEVILIDNYRRRTSFPSVPINRLREEAYAEAISGPIEPIKRLYSLNLPTGMGKTLIALAFACRLRHCIKGQTGVTPRIIYALPYLSIIDQNAKTIEQILNANNLSATTDIFLKHHHLSDVIYKTQDNEFDTNEAEILIEGWNSEITITTFVQIFHTLVTNRNRSLRKFHRLANSIIILDEVQTIPLKYWLLLHNLLQKLAEEFNSYIIFATATEPLIFSWGELTKLIPDRERYFQKLNRVTLRPLIDKPLTIEQFLQEFNIKADKSHLFILNTINSARQLYAQLRCKGITCTYLSSHLIPKQRWERIAEIKEGKHRIVISTQLVEAGVDIDFDVVVRDFAPLDSINQAAGRCNRNGKGKGEVYVINLQDGKGKSFASYIYDPVLLNITRNIISGKTEISESEFLSLVNQYYKETQEKKSQQSSLDLLNAVEKLRYDSTDEPIAVADFQLILEDIPQMDVFIEYDEEAANLWREFLSLKEISEPFKRKDKFDAIKSAFYQYVISVPKNVENKPETVGEMGYVKHSSLPEFYDPETGLILKDDRTLIIC